MFRGGRRALRGPVVDDSGTDMTIDDEDAVNALLRNALGAKNTAATS